MKSTEATSRRTTGRKRSAREAREQARAARRSHDGSRVLEAAGAAFARQGVPQTKVEHLAEEAGMMLAMQQVQLADCCTPEWRDGSPCA